MKCIFDTVGENHYKCVNCGFELKLSVDPSTIVKLCTSHEERAVMETLDSDIEAPSLVDQAKSFGSAMLDTIGAAMTGKDVVVDMEEQKRRLEICTGTDTKPKCQYFDQGKCQLCGCFTNFKSKLATSECPDGKW